MNTEIDVIQRALNVAPVCPGLKWGQAMLPSDYLDKVTDAHLNVKFNNKTFPFHIQVKLHLHRAAVERFIALNTEQRHGRLMLVSDHVNPKFAEILRETGISFLDASGNAFLDLPGLHLFVTGRKPEVLELPSSPARMFHRASVQIIFAFLTDPALDKSPQSALVNKTFRDIKSQTGVALGSIGTTIGTLLESGYIVEEEKLRFLIDRQQLLEKWMAAYTDRLRPKLIVQRYRSRGGSWWNGIQSLGPGNYWGGEVAAAKLTGYLKPELVTIYSRGDTQQLILDADLRLDPKGEVEILKVFWGNWPHGIQQDCVCPLLVYADLMASEIDRNMDTAKRIYDRYLREIIEPRR